MTSQLNEELAQRGFLTALDVSRKYKFGINFVRQVKGITWLPIILPAVMSVALQNVFVAK